MSLAKAITVKAMQRLDRFAIEKMGVPSAALMENAGCLTAKEILRDIKGKKNPKVSIFCGSGNNAGDGFVIARHLINAGVKTKVFLIGKAKSLKNDALINYKILKKCKYPVAVLKKIDRAVRGEILRSDCLVDAIFGTGLTREILDPFKSVVEELNKSKKRIVSVDIPSGLNGTTGDIFGVCIKANKTVTFAFAKKGFYKKYGPKMSGKVIVVDIGIPNHLLKKI